MKAKVNNLISEYEGRIAKLKAEFGYSDMRYTQIAMMEGFVTRLKAMRDS